MNTKYHVNSFLMTLALASVLALSAFAASESGARVSGVLLYDDETYSEANRIKVGTLFP